jgi:hypothetical protein
MGLDYSVRRVLCGEQLYYFRSPEQIGYRQSLVPARRRVDPDHRHRLVRFIDEAMGLSLGNQAVSQPLSE